MQKENGRFKKDQLEKERIEKERLEKDRLEKEKLNKERLEKERIENDFKDPIKEEERKQNLRNLFQISDNININDIASIMNLPRAETLKKLIAWKSQFKLKIDGDIVRMEKG